MKRIAVAALALLVSFPAMAAEDRFTLDKVNEKLNQQFTYVPEEGNADVWKASLSGDCEDLALAKRNALIARGWDPDDLVILILKGEARARGGYVAGHAVLYSKKFKAVLDMPFYLDHPMFIDTYLHMRHMTVACVAANIEEGQATASRCVEAPKEAEILAAK